MSVTRKTSLTSKPQKILRVNLDKILEDEIGLGKYQLKSVALCALVSFFTGYAMLNYVFVAARIKTRCKIPECDVESDQVFSPPWIANAVPTSGRSFDGCRRFAPVAAQEHVSGLPGSCPADLFDNTSIIKCAEYVYEHKNSAVYEFDLACDEWRWFFIGSSMVLGMAISLPMSGLVADRWGRRLALSLNFFNFAWVNSITYFANSYTTYVLGGFLGSLLGSSGLACANILALEHVAPKHRMATGCILMTCCGLGGTLLGLVAWTEPYWRHLILMIYSPMLIGFSFFWIAPESVRWLISKNRYEEAKAILMNAAKTNGKVLSDETIQSFSNQNNENKEEDSCETNLICLVFKHKVILIRCIIIPIWWISTSFVNQGMKIYAVGMSGNMFLNFSASSAIHIPSYWVTTVYMKNVGRKVMLVGGFWACAFCQLGCIFAPKDNYAAALALYLLAKFCISSTMLVMYVYTPELFPTSCRSRLTAFSSMVGRLGAFVAPLVPLASDVWEHLPSALFAALAFISGALTLLVPETSGTTLPDSMDDATKLGKEQPKTPTYILKEHSGM